MEGRRHPVPVKLFINEAYSAGLSKPETRERALDVKQEMKPDSDLCGEKLSLGNDLETGRQNLIGNQMKHENVEIELASPRHLGVEIELEKDEDLTAFNYDSHFKQMKQQDILSGTHDRCYFKVEDNQSIASLKPSDSHQIQAENHQSNGSHIDILDPVKTEIDESPMECGVSYKTEVKEEEMVGGVYIDYDDSMSDVQTHAAMFETDDPSQYQRFRESSICCYGEDQRPRMSDLSRDNPPSPHGHQATSFVEQAGHDLYPFYPCNKCYRAFSSPSWLERHVTTQHSSNYRKQTDDTGKCSGLSGRNGLGEGHRSSSRFGKTTDGNDGMRDKLYKCDVCGAAFARSGNMRRHMIIHTGEKPFKCTVCSAAFTQKCKLVAHMRVHTGEEPYKCGMCSATFPVSASLRRHIMGIHTGEKPYKCNECNVGFIESADLRVHMRIHTGERPFKCDVCSAAFSQNCNLGRHLRTHTGEIIKVKKKMTDKMD